MQRGSIYELVFVFFVKIAKTFVFVVVVVLEYGSQVRGGAVAGGGGIDL